MPQLIPFYYLTEVITAFGILTLFVMIFTYYFLPFYLNVRIVRKFVTDLII